MTIAFRRFIPGDPANVSEANPIVVLTCTPRLTIGSLVPGDASKYLEVVSDPDVKFHAVHEVAPNDIDQYRASIISKQGSAEGPFAVNVSENRALAGICGFQLRDISNLEPQMEIYIQLLPAFRRQRYGTEIIRCLLQWGFERLDCARLVGVAAPTNVGSKKLMLGVGMRRWDGVHPINAPSFDVFEIDAAQWWLRNEPC